MSLKSRVKWVGVLPLVLVSLKFPVGWVTVCCYLLLAALAAPCSGCSVCSEATVPPVGAACSCSGIKATEIDFLESGSRGLGVGQTEML